MNKFRSLLKNTRSLYRFSQYTERNPTTTYNDEIRGVVGQDGKLKPVSDTGFIHEVDDKYGLEEVRNPIKILAHLKSVNFDYPLDELVYFIRHLVHISETHGSRNQILASNTFKDLISHIKVQLKFNRHGFQPLIGSYAFCMQQLGVFDIDYQHDQELWLLLEQKILDDQFYTSFKESVYAVQGFTKMPRMLHGRSDEDIQQRIDQVYTKLERVVKITIWEVDVKYYHKIVTSLAKVNRFDPSTFGKLEQHILTNLSLDYNTQLMVDILVAFAKGKQGSKDFYDAIQYVIFKGHMFNKNFFVQVSEIHILIIVRNRSNQNMMGFQLQVYCKFTAKHKRSLMKICSFILILRVISTSQLVYYHIHQKLVNNKTTYSLESAVQTLKLLPSFNYEDTFAVKLKLIEKISKLEGQFQIDEIMAFYTYLEQNTQDSSDLPMAAIAQVEGNLFKYSDQLETNDLIDVACYLFQFERPLFLIKPFELSDKIIQIMDSKIDVVDFQRIERFNAIFQNYLSKLEQLEQDQEIKNYLQIEQEQSNKSTTLADKLGISSFFGFSLLPKPKEIIIKPNLVKVDDEVKIAYQRLSQKIDDFNKIKRLQDHLQSESKLLK